MYVVVCSRHGIPLRSFFIKSYFMDGVGSFYPFVFMKPITSNFTNSEDPDEMPYNAAFCEDLHCTCICQKYLQTKEYNIFCILNRYP